MLRFGHHLLLTVLLLGLTACCPCPPKGGPKPRLVRPPAPRGLYKLQWLQGCWVGKLSTSTVRECSLISWCSAVTCQLAV